MPVCVSPEALTHGRNTAMIVIADPTIVRIAPSFTSGRGGFGPGAPLGAPYAGCCPYAGWAPYAGA